MPATTAGLTIVAMCPALAGVSTISGMHAVNVHGLRGPVAFRPAMPREEMFTSDPAAAPGAHQQPADGADRVHAGKGYPGGHVLAHRPRGAARERGGRGDGHDVSVARLSIPYTLQLGLLPLPKSTNPAHMKDNADVDFVISDEDMERLKNVEPIEDYGEASDMPVSRGSTSASRSAGSGRRRSRR